MPFCFYRKFKTSPFPKYWISVLLVSVALLLLYCKVLMGLVHQWRSQDMYSYGFLVPVISGYLIWNRRKKFNWSCRRPNYRFGLPVIALGLIILMLGISAKILTIQEISFPVVIAGTVICFYGLHQFKFIAVPIAYLYLMIPIWDIFTEPLHLPFQMFTAGNAIAMLNFVGIPAYRQGTYVELPDILLEVAKACSGVNYLIAIVAIGIPLAYLYVRGWKKRAILVGVAVAIAILANGIRVALIGMHAYWVGITPVHGPAHIFQGLFVSILGYLALFVGLLLLREKRPNAHSKKCASKP
jgi:exosortase